MNIIEKKKIIPILFERGIENLERKNALTMK